MNKVVWENWGKDWRVTGRTTPHLTHATVEWNDNGTTYFKCWKWEIGNWK